MTKDDNTNLDLKNHGFKYYQKNTENEISSAWEDRELQGVAEQYDVRKHSDKNTDRRRIGNKEGIQAVGYSKKCLYEVIKTSKSV